jgi:hypothetical protein
MGRAGIGTELRLWEFARKSVFSRPSTGGGARATRNVSTAYPFNFCKGFGLAVAADLDHGG